jgi:DNA-binding NarL/FixJ family response regulator
VRGTNGPSAADRTNGRNAILIVDDDADFVEAVGGILERAGYSPTIANRGEEALRIVRTEQPRLVILDVGLPDLSGYEVCRQLKERFGDGLPILFVSGLRTESFDRVAGLLIGADDYLGKPFAADELLARVRRLVRQTASLAPSMASRLTPRELEVLRLLANGLGQDEIARQLFISRKTVATHIEHVLQKLGVRTRAQAVAMAYREDLVAEASS